MLSHKHFAVRWWILLAAGISLLCFAEFQLRLHREKLLSAHEGNRREIFQKDPELIYKGIPYVGSRNSQGYRDVEHSFIKPANTFRIVIIGDSIAQGQNVRMRKTFGRVLENRLNAKNPNKKFEVIILAIAGYSTWQEIILLKKEAFLYKPDLILWSYCLNDPATATFHVSINKKSIYFYQPNVLLWSYLQRQIFYFAETLKGRIFQCEKEYHAYLHCTHWNEVETNFKRISDLTQAHNVPVILLIHPVFSKKMGNFEYNPTVALEARLTALAAKSHMAATINLFEAYKSQKLTDVTFTYQDGRFDPWHPNAEGHRIAGEYIADVITKRFLNP